MSQKQSKKMRKVFRQEFDRTYRETAEKLVIQRDHFLKKKPELIPMWLWVNLLKIFVKIK